MYSVQHWSLHVDFICCSILSLGEEGDDADLEAPKIYEMLTSFDQLKDKLTGYQAQYNETIRGAKMDLVFFKVLLRPLSG